jgi:hypothetical protein
MATMLSKAVESHITPGAEEIVTTATDPIHTPELINEVLQTAWREFDNEEKRRTAQDVKATSLLAAAGVSVGLTANFVALFIARLPNDLAWRVIAVFLFVPTFAFAVFAAYKALTALRVEVQPWLNERDIFRPEALTFSDEEKEREIGIAMYRKQITAALWLTYHRLRSSRQDRARRVRQGQQAFVLFLCCLGCIAIVFCIMTVVR